MHIVLFSGGAGSWAAAKRVASQHGTSDLVLLFTDTKSEDEDLYRFLPEAAANVGGRLEWIADGRDIWQVFNDRNMMGSTRVDVCSRQLKRDLSKKYVHEHNPDTTTVYVGIDWSEYHRFERMSRYWHPYRIEAPMTKPPYMTKGDVLDWLKAEGIQPPRLYEMGFKHNNCGGFCVKGGHGQFAHLLRTMPDRYSYHEERERQFRARVGKDVAILRDRRNGTLKPLTLEAFRHRVEASQPIDELDWSACACVDPSEEEVKA
jgi:3'-phosphoadenosine 5'-phosphosulfate sulfotransferase (PAPS reductase)/FAD synthetase